MAEDKSRDKDTEHESSFLDNQSLDGWGEHFDEDSGTVNEGEPAASDEEAPRSPFDAPESDPFAPAQSDPFAPPQSDPFGQSEGPSPFDLDARRSTEETDLQEEQADLDTPPPLMGASTDPGMAPMAPPRAPLIATSQTEGVAHAAEDQGFGDLHDDLDSELDQALHDVTSITDQPSDEDFEAAADAHSADVANVFDAPDGFEAPSSAGLQEVDTPPPAAEDVPVDEGWAAVREPMTDQSLSQSTLVEETEAAEPAQEAAPAPRRRLDPLPLDAMPPEGQPSWLSEFKLFQMESQKLARIGSWRKLAAMMGHALNDAPYSTRMTRTGMLLDLAQLYRDRLKDAKRAEETFAVLAEEDPASAEALDFLTAVYEQRADWGSTYDLYTRAVEATWDPNQRLEWTQLAAEIAEQRLGQIELATQAWEHLWKLGDSEDVAARTLARYYRKAGRWADMADFLRTQSDRAEGPTQLVTLRELAEVLLSGLRSPDGASGVLEQIVSHSPGDAIATLQLARVYAQRKEWGQVERLGNEAATEESETAFDLQHLVADALWNADRLDQAVAAYERILEIDPSNHDGLQRKREFFVRTERHAELLTLLEDRADTATDDKERAQVLAEAADLAENAVLRPEKAAELWRSYVALSPDEIEGYRALQRLYEALDQPAGVAEALDGQLRLTKDHQQRVALLRHMGEQYARRLQDDESAEACWKRILALDPSDLPTREELTELHRRRQDYEALNSSLLRQIWITDDEERAERLCRMAAENLDQNFEDPERSIEAWRRVLDFRPMDLQALEQLAKHYRTLENNRELIAVLEQQIRAVNNKDRRIELALQIAELWEKEPSPKAAAATYERVFSWDPTNQLALDALVRIYGAHDQCKRALGVIEHASAHVDRQRQLELARQGLELLPKDAHKARFFQLKRLLHLSGGDVAIIEELAKAAEEAKLWPEQAAVLLQLASEQESHEDRVEILGDLARIYEEKLDDPDRAYLLQQSVLLSPEHRQEVLGDLSRLAEETKRHEDLLAFLDCLTTSAFDLDERKRLLVQRAEICEKKLEAPLRAFHEHRRCLELDPADWAPLAELERLAKVNDLWQQFDATLAALSDRCEVSSQRMELLARREAIAREHLEDTSSAFDFLVRRYRVDSNDLEILQTLTEDAQALDGWDWLLPVIEAAQLAPVEDAEAEELMISAAFYEEKLQEHGRAFALYREVFVMQPGNETVLAKLEELADAAKRHEQLADALRMAAATSTTNEQTVRLLRKIAKIYEVDLASPARAIDIHRRLLELQPDETTSLEVMIGWHRERKEWRDLRDRLRQWVGLSDEKDDQIEKLLEIASISQQNLDDPEEALQAYGDVLERDDSHEKAREGLDGLVSSINEPALRKRWLMMQLEDANEGRAVELRLEIARILEQDLDDAGGAITTLQELVESGGATGPGFEPVARLLREHQRWEDLVLLLQKRAEQLEDESEKLATLDEALSTCQRQLGDSAEELLEQLYRSILTLRPTDREVRTLLSARLRESGRFEELCELLEAELEHQGPAERTAIRFELARLYEHNLDEKEKSRAIYERILEEDPEAEGALLALAEQARQAEDLEGYVALRERQAKMLPPAEAALVLCHLAEFCDEHEALENRKVRFYREARTVDPDNVPAMEALKGIGRRLKNLRPMAALLPLEGEREIALEERAARLRALGDETRQDSPLVAVDWYQRAAAVAPFEPESWRALAEGLLAIRDAAGAYRARRIWLQAKMRLAAFDASKLQEEAQQIYALAEAAQEAELPQDHAMWVQRAFELVPSFAPAALAAAEAQLSQGQTQGALSLFDTVVEQHQEVLDDEQRTAAYFGRGSARQKLGDQERALDDFRSALRIRPLHGECLVAMGEQLAEAGRYPAALEHLIRALVVVDAPEERAGLHHRIGVLWEDGLDRLDEAGSCYELAVAEGLDDRDLLHRALRHYKRSGRLDESLDVVEGLLPTAEEASELATLWLMRGEILSAHEDAEDQAIEAFDMALSYDPGCQQARDGLTAVLEKRGDWQQLLQVLEASADAGTPPQRAEAMMRLARVATEQLGDLDKAEEYLRRSIDVHPTKDALQEMERLCGDDPARQNDRRDVLGLLVGFGPPFFERCLELGRMLLEENQEWAWCLLSPLLGVSQIDQDIKGVVQGMRKEFERAELRCAAGLYDQLAHPDSSPELTEVLTEVEEVLGELGLRDIESMSGCVTVGTNTSLGKTFAALAKAVDLQGATLHRTQTLPASVVIVNEAEAPRVLVRTEVMQQLVHAEVGFLFAYALELAQPGQRLLASLSSDEERGNLIAGIWQAVGFTSGEKGQAASIAQQLEEQVDEATRQRWADTLGQLGKEEPRTYCTRWWNATLSTARRAGVLAGPDMRQVFRVVARMEESVPRPRVVSRLAELDDYVGEAEIFADLLGFAASPAFGKLLREAETVGID